MKNLKKMKNILINIRFENRSLEYHLHENIPKKCIRIYHTRQQQQHIWLILETHIWGTTQCNTWKVINH